MSLLAQITLKKSDCNRGSVNFIIKIDCYSEQALVTT